MTTTIGTILPDDFGEGWMSANARDYTRIAVWAGFPADELLEELTTKHTGKANLGTVERACAAVTERHPEWKKEP